MSGALPARHEGTRSVVGSRVAFGLSLPTKQVDLLIDDTVDEDDQRVNLLLERLNSLLDVSEA